jgi:transposase
LKPEETRYLDRLCKLCPELSRAYQLSQAFTGMVRSRDVDKLDQWLEDAAQSKVAELKSFAKGLRRDYQAVRAALTQDWSQGQVEGQVNRLKLLKRQTYGRAKFDLLRARVLYAG